MPPTQRPPGPACKWVPGDHSVTLGRDQGRLFVIPALRPASRIPFGLFRWGYFFLTLNRFMA